MFRKVGLAVAVAALVLTRNAFALGLGDIELHSALNQPFKADIHLLSVRPGELKDATVSLAPLSAFQSAKLDYPVLLSKLKFEISQAPDGSAVITVSSRNAINEPFLDFLVQLSWPNGRLLREYTVLLDPPVLMKEKPPAVAAPTPMPAAPTESAPAQLPPPTPTPAPAAPITEYGPTRPGETLWAIAAKVQPDASVTVNQVMQALLEANPHAFVKRNINGLKRGFVLRVPDSDQMASMSAAEARAATREQYRAWRAAQRRMAKAPVQAKPETPAAEAPASAQAKPEGHLKIVAPSEGEQGKTTGEQVAGGEQPPAEPPKDVADLRRQYQLLNESAAALRNENQDLRNRLGDLQKQITTLNRLLSLKDDQLAAMQAGATKTEGQAPTAAPAPATEQAAAGQAPVAKPAQPAPPAQATPMPVKPEPAKPAAKPKPLPEEQGYLTMAEEMLGKVTRDPMLLAGAGGGLAILLLLGWFWSRRRRMERTEFQESILAASPKPGSDTAPISSMLESDSGQETSSVSDFGAISGMGDIETEVGEVDPLAEADVYIAYGRYQQAEDMLNDAITGEPDRVDLKLKLLEVYYATKNQKAFEDNAEALYAALGGEADPAWNRVVSMGRDLAPMNPLFSDASADAAEPVITSEPAAEPPQAEPSGAGEEDLLGDLGLGEELEAVAPAEEAPVEPESPKAGGAEQGLDFDLGDFGVPAAAPAAEAVHDAEGGIEFDLGDFNLDSSASTELEAAAAEQPAEDESFVLDTVAPVAADEDHALDLPEEFAALGELSAELEEKPAAVEQGEALDLGGLDIDLGAEVAPEERADEAQPLPAMEDISLNQVLVEPASEESDEALGLDGLGELELNLDDEGEEADGGLFEMMDEVGTKLDLAKAYIDMGDPDGARSILEEVLAEGDEQQKKEAEGLMQQIV